MLIMESSIAPPIDKKKPHPQVAREAWKQELADAVRDPSELCNLLDLDSVIAEKAKKANRDFPFLVPRGFISRSNRVT